MSEAAEFADLTPVAASAAGEGDRNAVPAAPSPHAGSEANRRSIRSVNPVPPESRRRNRAAGVTGRGVIALVLLSTALAGLVDVAISGHRGHLFGVVFVIASAFGALVVRRRDVPTAMVAPPLLYCVLISLMSLVDRAGLSGGLVTTEAFYLGNAFVTGAPAIWSGTALACMIGWYRRRR